MTGEIARRDGRDDQERVYPLYAASNFGPLATVLSYLFVVEPLLSESSRGWPVGARRVQQRRDLG